MESSITVFKALSLAIPLRPLKRRQATFLNIVFIYLFGITLLKQWHQMYVHIGASIKTISKYNSYNSWY